MNAAAIGAVVGSRSLLVPAMISRTTRRVKASRVLSLLAAMELAADKTPWIPSRTAPLSLAGRMLLGAGVALGMASSRRWPGRSSVGVPVASALAGAMSAAASAFLLRALRVRVGGRSRAANVLGGLLEDLAALGAGRALARTWEVAR